jgi:hypothetical protein
MYKKRGGGGGMQLWKNIWFGIDDLCKPSYAEILSNVIIREVAKPSHPDICGNKDTNCIVYLCRSKIMVHQEYDLFQEKKIKKRVSAASDTLHG